MKLAELLKPWINTSLPDITISDIHNDSRHCGQNYLFLAYPGAASDGRRYINQALTAGAAFVVYESTNWPADCPLPGKSVSVAISGLAEKLAEIASRFYDKPAKKLSLTGVTGTNGKTTIAFQLAQAHSALARRSAYIGTLGEGEAFALNLLQNTTPDALCLQRLLYQYQQQGIKQVCMEVSSHALSQQRVAAIDFKQAIFTNLTLDHLDYHHTMEDYAAAKARLFAIPSLEWAIINKDDSYAALMSAAVKKSCQVLSYGTYEGCDVQALSWKISMSGTEIAINSPWGKHRLQISALGFFNVYNALAIFCSLMVEGYSVEEVIRVMATLQPAPGRMEVVMQKPCVLVDYAHTPDALENVLTTLNEVKEGKIVVVFDCGGDRDKSKRPLMGRIAADNADIAIMTSDNPRTEDPLQIMDDIEKGITDKSKLFKIVDREEAIAKAISLANPEDIIVVAGKGHEAYQQIGQIRHKFSDQEVIRRLMANVGNPSRAR